MRLFFYGTLMDEDLRRLVLGAELSAEQITPGLAKGFRRVHVAGRSYPMLLPHSTGQVRGQLADGLGEEAVTRLTLYEGSEYAMTTIPVETAQGREMALVYLCHANIAFDPRPWSLETWRRRHKRRTLRRVAGAMGKGVWGP